MAEKALTTTFAEPKNRGNGQSGPISRGLSFAANTSANIIVTGKPN